MADASTARHRALADERRARVVDELRTEPGGVDVHELAERLGLHPNTVRWHLGVLSDAGLVVSAPAARSAPGRPRILYSLSPDGQSAASGGDDHKLLAMILTGVVASEEDGAARAREAGRAWGRYLVSRPSPLEPVSEDAAVAEVVRILEDEGFAPELDGLDVRMRRCPFHDLAEQHPEVVCGIHEGLLASALAELGAGIEVEGLDVFVLPDLCVARLSRGRARAAS